MKCPLCDGKGEYMHACGGYRPCEHCNGTGKVKQTRADYMRQCDDTDLAWEIWQLIKDGNTDSLYHIEKWLQEEYQEGNDG